MEFIASITLDVGYVRKIRRLWKMSGDTRNPLKNVLVSPLFTPQKTLDVFRELRENNEVEQIYFDSGAYSVQKGRISYEEMYWSLLNYYRENDWADWYVLPDYVPLSSDSPEDVWYKVQTTANMSSLFYAEMPERLKLRALPVVQGHSVDQIEYCLESYLKMDGIQRIGFGSFPTNGKNSNVNTLSPSALAFLSHLTNILSAKDIGLHAFGVGTPPVIFLLHEAGVRSFDSVGWMKTAGFGKIYMPFVRAYNITYRDQNARGLTEQAFLELKKITNHDCIFCQSFDTLAQSRDYRFMHNLTAVMDTIDQLKNTPLIDIEKIMELYSPYYAKMGAGVTI
jgi:queuine/archaeosine tRNA-ribosyltransferase